jgi:glycosyltransferase involved in cell wall biosynthesis
MKFQELAHSKYHEQFGASEMDKLPRITVITPSYNQGDFIEQTIESILGQNYPDLEYLVFDGGSTDQTVDLLKKYGQKFFWVSTRDRGQSDAINQGLQRASGEVICFLNSDDVYEPGALLKVGSFFADHPEAAWLTGKCRVIDPAGVEIRKPVAAYKNFWLRFKSYKVLLVLDYISQPATFWRREVIQQVGPFDESLHLTMDYDYSLRVGQHYRLHVLNENLASFRVHPASKSGFVQKHFDEDLSIARRYTRSKLLLRLHALHNALIVATYRRIQAPRGKRAISPI